MKKGNLFIFIGSLLIFAGIMLSCYNLWSQWQAGRAAQDILSKMAEITTEAYISNNNENISEPASELASDDMSGVQIDGDVYVGVLNIPKLGLTLPVMKELDYKKLRFAPCRYKGSVEEKNLIIAGHNYNTHFGRLKQLSEGDEISFSDVNGNSYDYTVCETDLIDGKNSTEMSAGEWDLSLFTCNLSGAARVTVRCRLEGASEAL